MSTRDGTKPITFRSEQGIQNLSFDDLYNLLATMLVGEGPDGAYRIQTDKAGHLLTGGLVPESYDDIALTYVGATDAIDTVTYSLDGIAICTLTLGYDGSDRLDSVTRS